MRSFLRTVGFFLAVVLCFSAVFWLYRLVDNWNHPTEVSRPVFTVPEETVGDSVAYGQTLKLSEVCDVSSVDLSSYLTAGKHYEIYIDTYNFGSVDEEYNYFLSFDWENEAESNDHIHLSQSGVVTVTEETSYGDGINNHIEGIVVLEGEPVHFPYFMVDSKVPDCQELDFSYIGDLSSDYRYFIRVLLYDSSEGKYIEDTVITTNNTGTYEIYSVNRYLALMCGKLSVKYQYQSNLNICGYFICVLESD